MIYFLAPLDRSRIKIGTSLRLSSRLRTLTREVGQPLEVLGVMRGEQARERAIHTRFDAYRIGGEWFEPAKSLLTYIKRQARPWDGRDDLERPNSYRFAMPTIALARGNQAARSIGLSLSAFIRQAVLEKTVDTERRMGL